MQFSGDSEIYSTHSGSIECTMLVLWPHKYKVGPIDLILIYHHNLLNSPEIPEFSYVSQLEACKFMERH